MLHLITPQAFALKLALITALQIFKTPGNLVKNRLNFLFFTKDGKVHLFYRTDDNNQIPMQVDEWPGILYTSRIGLAIRNDGLHFECIPSPVLLPNNDHEPTYEWQDGCEDPRIVESENGTYVITYTPANHPVDLSQWKALLAVATSTDLIHWKKHGYAFAQAHNGTFGRRWSKSGSIVCRLEGDKLIATKIDGKYLQNFIVL